MDFLQTWYVYQLILWRSGLGLLMGKFHHFFMELSAGDTPIFLFPDLVNINGFSPNLETHPYFRFPDNNE